MPDIFFEIAITAIAKGLLQMILTFLAVSVVMEKHIGRQPAVRIAAAP